jgi:predicted secreted Zn-dependent protease
VSGKAKECFKLAKLARDPAQRRAFEEIGHQWLALAADIERDEKRHG